MPNPTDIITKAITDVVASKGPELIRDAISKAAKEQDDALAEATMNLLAGLVEKHGAGAINQLTDQVIDLVKGDDPLAAFQLKDMPDELEALVSALQGAEAERRIEAQDWARALGSAMRDFAKLAASAIGVAISGAGNG